MLAVKTARGYMSSFADSDPSPEQLKRNLELMRNAVDEVVIGEKRRTKGDQKQLKKKKVHGIKMRNHHY